MPKRYIYPNIQEKNINYPRIFSYIFGFFWFFFTLISYNWFNQVFNGQIKVNQSISLFKEVYFDFEIFKIPLVADLLQISRQYPIGDIDIRFYSICILVGFLLGYFVTLFFARQNAISGTVIDRVLIGLVAFGLIGARLFFVIFHLDYYDDRPLAILLELNSGGLAFFGAFIACFIYIFIYCNRFKFNFYEFLDTFTPGILLGQIIGRFGNFFNYESYGPETSVYWKMFVPPGAPFYDQNLLSRYFHPTFLYEIIPNIILLFFILFYYNNLTKKRTGLVFAIYAIGYGSIRFVTEFFRLDSLKIYFPEFMRFNFFGAFNFSYILPSQIMSLILLIYGIYLVLDRKDILYIRSRGEELEI